MKNKKPQLKQPDAEKSMWAHHLLSAFIMDEKDWEKLKTIGVRKKQKPGIKARLCASVLKVLNKTR